LDRKNVTGVASREIIDEPHRLVAVCADAKRSQLRELRLCQYRIYVVPVHNIMLIVCEQQTNGNPLHFTGDDQMSEIARGLMVPTELDSKGAKTRAIN
jgi:hypothetical protein